MKKHFEIREYTSEDQQKFLKLYLLFGEKKKRSRVLHELRKNNAAKRTWQAGLVGIIGIHLSYLFNSANAVKYSYVFSALPTILVEMLLFTTGVGFAWYKWSCWDYDKKLLQSSKRMALELQNVHKNDKSNAWVMVDGSDNIVGTVALKYENNEGKIGYLTGEDKEQRVDLVKHAFRFGQTNKIEVISKLRHEDSKWSEYSL